MKVVSCGMENMDYKKGVKARPECRVPLGNNDDMKSMSMHPHTAEQPSYNEENRDNNTILQNN